MSIDNLELDENIKSLDEAMLALDSLIDSMDNEAMGLENMFALYSDGIDLIKYCETSIDTIEKNIAILNEGLVNDEEAQQ